MNRYDSFETFMVEVVNKANEISNLNDLFDVKYEALISKLNRIIEYGWWVFIALCALLVMGSIAFGISVGTFLLTPPGLIIGGILGIAAAATLRQIYKNKELPLAIKKIGSMYESRWKNARGNRDTIDLLFKDAVKDLLNSGKHSLSYSALNMLAAFVG